MHVPQPKGLRQQGFTLLEMVISVLLLVDAVTEALAPFVIAVPPDAALESLA